MAEELDMIKAKEVYDTIVSMMDAIGWKYEKHEEDLVIKSGAQGDDLPMDLLLIVDPKSQIVQLISRMPFNVPEDKRFDAAVAICVANYGLKDGSFDYDINDGEIRFRLTSSYRESILSKELFVYMIGVSIGTIDQYNDKFFMLSKGVMSIQQFIEQENQ